jgi:hypothetical protein
MADTESTYSATIPESRDWEKVFPWIRYEY